MIGLEAPTLIYKVDPPLSKEERKQKIKGITLVNLIIDDKGEAANVRIVRSLATTTPANLQAVALSFDQRALDAVSQYRFKPATCNGKPVSVELNVEVNFNIY
jgi:protein TonB